MHRARTLLLGAAASTVIVAMAALSACGTTAPTTAATVAGRTVDVASVEQLAADAEFLEFGLGLAGTEEPPPSSLPGELTRTVLAFEIEVAAWLALADLWELELDAAALELGEQILDEERDRARIPGGDELPRFSDTVRQRFAERFAAQQLLGERLAQLDPSDDVELRRLYDLTPGLWQRTCLDAVELDTSEVGAARTALDGGAAVTALPEQLETAQVVTEDGGACFPVDQVVPELRAAIENTAAGSASEVVEVDAGPFPAAYVVHVRERQQLSFDDARDELSARLASYVTEGPTELVNLLMLSADVDPRFGSGVEPGPEGRPLVVAPQRPLAAPTTSVPFDGLDLPAPDPGDLDLEDLDLEDLDLSDLEPAVDG